jgi:hypothetical protein
MSRVESLTRLAEISETVESAKKFIENLDPRIINPMWIDVDNCGIKLSWFEDDLREEEDDHDVSCFWLYLTITGNKFFYEVNIPTHDILQYSSRDSFDVDQGLPNFITEALVHLQQDQYLNIGLQWHVCVDGGFEWEDGCANCDKKAPEGEQAIFI